MRNKKAKITKNTDVTEVEDEARRIFQEVLVTAKDMEETKYYRHIAGLFGDDPVFQRHLNRVCGPHPKPVLMVIYALGSPELSHHSQYQLAVAIRLKWDFPRQIGDIQLYDPVFSPADRQALKMLGLRVLFVNEHFRRPVKEPTLFFLPSPNIWHVGNLLDVNWCASRLNWMMILSNSLYDRNPCEKLTEKEKDQSLCRRVYSGILRNYATIFNIPTNFHGSYLYIFGDLSFSFFELDPMVDLESLLPDYFKQWRKERQQGSDEADAIDNHDDLRELMKNFFEKQFKQRNDFNQFDGYGYRLPRQYRCEWRPPPAGWWKLNFSGKASDKVSQAGYGGILHNKKGDFLVTCSGGLGKLEDATVVNAKALTEGLRLLKHIPGGVKQLIVEGTDLSVLRWANSGPEPPGKVKEAVDNILKVVAPIRTVIYHVYEEANKEAITLAKKGATSQDQHVEVFSKMGGKWAKNLAKLITK